MSPVEIHTNRHQELTTHLSLLNNKANKLSVARLIFFLASLAAPLILWPEGTVLALLAFIFFISIFIYFVSRDLINKEAIENTRFLVLIQENELSALRHQFTHFPEGNEWKPSHHDYANDLDIFGRASLYQFINRTSSEQAGKMLANWLLYPSNKETILHRQASMKELAAQKHWFQQLHAFGLRKRISILTQEKISEWSKEEVQFINKPFHFGMIS